MAKIYFISDLHLSARYPEITKALERFLSSTLRAGDTLYILGDLFDYWIGDDDNNPFFRKVMQQLKTTSERGIHLFVMHGNRDFLLGKRFEKETGSTIIPDPFLMTYNGEPYLLMHGDTLCTDDVNYLAYRAKVRKPWLLFILTKLPLFIRKKLADKLRNQSQEAVLQKAQDIMDVNQTEVEKVMQQHSVKKLIHGHTHRPCIHQFQLAGETYTRIVLGDWDHSGQAKIYQMGSDILHSLSDN